MKNKTLIIISIVLVLLSLVFVIKYSSSPVESSNSRALSTVEGVDCASGMVNFNRNEFKDAQKHGLQYIKKYVKFPKHIKFPKVVKSLQGLDMTNQAMVELETAYITPKGFWLYLYSWPKFWNRHWTLSVNWLVYDDNEINHKLQSGSGVVYQSNDRKRVTKTTWVDFPKPFETKPKVALFLSGYASEDSNLKMIVSKITEKGFEIISVNHRNKRYWWFIYDYVASTTKSVDIHTYHKACWPDTKKCNGINKGKGGTHHLTFNNSAGKVRLTGHGHLDYSGNIRSIISNNTSGKNKITTWSNTRLWNPVITTVVIK